MPRVHMLAVRDVSYGAQPRKRARPLTSAWPRPKNRGSDHRGLTSARKHHPSPIRMTRPTEAIAAYHAAMAAGRTPEAISAARAADAASHKELNVLRAQPDNAECFDCTARKPGWAALPHGIYLCIDCAQVHRHLGRHISQVKAINTGTYLWMPYELAVMRAIGNARAARAYRNAPPKPKAGAPAEAKRERAQALYGDHRWGAPQYEQESAAPQMSPLPAPSLAPSPAPVQGVGAGRPARKPKMTGALLLKPRDAGFADLISFDTSPGATVDTPASLEPPMSHTVGVPGAEDRGRWSQPQVRPETVSDPLHEYNCKKEAVLATFMAPHQEAASPPRALPPPAGGTTAMLRFESGRSLPSSQRLSTTQPPAPSASFFEQFGL